MIGTPGDEQPRASAQAPDKLGPLLRSLVSPPVAPPQARAAGVQSSGADLAAAPVSALSQVIALGTGPTPAVEVLIQTSESDAALASAGAVVRSRIGSIVSATMPVSSLGVIAGRTGVLRVEAS